MIGWNVLNCARPSLVNLSKRVRKNKMDLTFLCFSLLCGTKPEHTNYLISALNDHSDFIRTWILLQKFWQLCPSIIKLLYSLTLAKLLKSPTRTETWAVRRSDRFKQTTRLARFIWRRQYKSLPKVSVTVYHLLLIGRKCQKTFSDSIGLPCSYRTCRSCKHTVFLYSKELLSALCLTWNK